MDDAEVTCRSSSLDDLAFAGMSALVLTGPGRVKSADGRTRKERVGAILRAQFGAPTNHHKVASWPLYGAERTSDKLKPEAPVPHNAARSCALGTAFLTAGEAAFAKTRCEASRGCSLTS